MAVEAGSEVFSVLEEPLEGGGGENDSMLLVPEIETLCLSCKASEFFPREFCCFIVPEYVRPAMAVFIFNIREEALRIHGGTFLWGLLLFSECVC